MELSYTDYKTLVTTKSLHHQHHLDTDDVDKYYHLFAYDASISYECNINSVQHASSVSDYEANLLSGANKTSTSFDTFGINVSAPGLEYCHGLYPKKQMYKYTVTADQINFFDILVNTEKKLCGGEYWIDENDVDNVHADDIVEFSIVDKDNILGLFATYGLTEGVDVLELTKFVINDYVRKGAKTECYHSHLYEGIKGINSLITGLYMRIMYDSNGTTNLTFMSRIYYYE